MKLFDKSKKPEKEQSPEPFLLSGDKEWSFDDVNLEMLEKWEVDKENLVNDITAKFMGAAQHNQKINIRKGIQANIPLNLVGSEGYTLLTKAVRHNAVDVVNILLEMGLNPAYSAGERGFNALHAAAAGGHYDLAVKLLQHPSNKMNKEMTDSRDQSILQIAILNHQFDFARKWLAEQNPDLKHLDGYGRTALATALGCYIRSTFNTEIEANNRQSELETFCIEMLTKENAFTQMTPHSKPAIQVILHTQFALNLSPGERTPPTMIPAKAVLMLLLEAPKLSKELLKQANENPGAKLAAYYIKYYQQADLSKTTLDMAIKNKSESAPKK